MNILYKKILKYTGIVTGSVILILIVITLAINFLFRNEIIKYAISQVNSQVNAKIYIQTIDFSIWKSFPYVSVNLNQVHAMPSNTYLKLNNIKTSKSDTLLISDRVSLQFNIYKILTRNYVLKRIVINDGYLNLHLDKSGNLSYDILNHSVSTDSIGSLVDLQNVILLNSKIRYMDERNDVHLSAFCSNLQLKGKIKTNNINFLIHCNLLVNDFSVDNNSYLKNRKFISKFNLQVIDQQKYIFNNIKSSVDEIELNGNGLYKTGKIDFVSFMFKGDDLKLPDVVNLLSDNIKDKLKDYSPKGNVNIKLKVEGNTGNGYIPKVDIAFALENGTVNLLHSSIRATELTCSGSYTNGLNKSLRSSELKIDKFLTKVGTGEISLIGKITNFETPYIQVSGISLLDISQIKEFFKLDTFERLSGKIESNFTVSGKLPGFSKMTASDVSQLTYSGQINIHDGEVWLKGNNFDCNKINGLVTLDNDFNFNHLTFTIYDNDILLNGKLINGINFVFNKNTDATLQADLTSQSLDLSRFFIKGEQGTDTAYSRKILFPDHFNLDLKLNINEFKLNKFNAKWVKGYLQYKPRMFILKALTFETLEGRLSGNGAVLQDIDQNIIVRGQFDVSKVNIQQMFYTFNNFGQNVVQDRHLRGKVSGNVYFSSEWNQFLEYNPDKLFIEGDITITNGELVNFEPLLGLSRFIAVDELKNIKFSTLTNKILVKDKQIIIPEMDVHSSAFNISGSGTHLFDNHYTYKIKVLLSEVLYGKARKAKKENEEFGVVEDDGYGHTGLYLTITGYNTDYKITYDSRKAIDVVKQSFSNQRKELKQIFHDEFGWFKKDTLLNSNKQEKAVKIKWDDADSIETVSPDVNPKPKKPSDSNKEDNPVKVEWE